MSAFYRYFASLQITLLEQRTLIPQESLAHNNLPLNLHECILQTTTIDSRTAANLWFAYFFSCIRTASIVTWW